MNELRVRALIEQSYTVSVPSIAAHIVTFMSIQQKNLCCRIRRMRRYFKDASVVKRIRATFAEQIALDASKRALQDAIALVQSYPKLYVLKREQAPLAIYMIRYLS